MSSVPLPFDDLGAALLLLREESDLTQVQVAERTPSGDRRFYAPA